MKLENSFTVDAPAEAAWDLLMDVPRIVPCMPGAALDEVVDDSHWKATMQVKLGPIGLTFATDVERTEADEAAKRVVLKANARDVRNRGRAEATIESSLATANGATRIDLVTDLALTGTVAQFGRGLVQDISSQLVTSFAQCLLIARPTSLTSSSSRSSRRQSAGGLRETETCSTAICSTAARCR